MLTNKQIRQVARRAIITSLKGINLLDIEMAAREQFFHTDSEDLKKTQELIVALNIVFAEILEEKVKDDGKCNND